MFLLGGFGPKQTYWTLLAALRKVCLLCKLVSLTGMICLCMEILVQSI